MVFILFIYNKYFINNYKLLYINSINYNKNINYMEEIYKWIESNCHALKYEFDVENNDNCIVKVINPVLNAVQREMLSKLFSDDVDVNKLCKRQDGITSCYIWYLAYLITHLDRDMYIGILVPSGNAGQDFFSKLKDELCVQELDGLKVLEFSHKVIKYENGGHKITIRLIVSTNDYVGKTFNIILCDGWTCRSRHEVFDYVRVVHLANSESRHWATASRWVNYMTDEPKIRMEDMLVN